MKPILGKTKLVSLSLLALSISAFQTPVYAENFQQALVSAYQRNNLLHAERARVREVDESYVQAKVQGGLNVSGSASAGFSRTESDIPAAFGGGIQKLKPRNVQLSIVQPLYQGGRVKGLKAQAKAGVLSARQGLRNAEQNVLLAAATAYLDVLRDEKSAVIRRNNVKVLTRQRYAAQERFNVGEGTRTDIAQADARLASADIGLSQSEAQLAISRAAYIRYMGHVPNALSRPPTYVLPATLQAAQIRGRANNPQIVAARYSENAAMAGIFVAKSAHKPTLSLNGALQGSRDRRSESASITAQLRVPIYSGGGNKSRVRAAKQAQVRSRFETREAEHAIDETIANIWAQVEASRQVLVSSRKQVTAAEVAFEGVELEQQVGTRTTLDVLNAEQELLNAKLSVIQGERNVRLATYQLLVTLGGFDAYSLQLPVALYDPQENFNTVSDLSIGDYLPRPLNVPVKAVEPIFEKVGSGVGDLVDEFGSKIVKHLPDLEQETKRSETSVASQKIAADVIFPSPEVILLKEKNGE